MTELRFDGRVAVVTGGGRGVGRAHAMLLASRRARVVVNDVGGDVEGLGADPRPAEAVVGEIAALGGEAIASTDSVADPKGAQAIVAAAVEHFGRVDIVINNAGIVTLDDFPDIDPEVYQRHLAVHLIGSFNLTKESLAPFRAAELRSRPVDRIERDARRGHDGVVRERQDRSDWADAHVGATR